MVTEYQNHKVDNSYTYISSGVRYRGQTFTVAIEHTVTQVKLKCYRLGSPGTVNVEIQGTTDSKPDNSAIASGSFNGSAITDDTAGEIVTIDLGEGALLSAETMYAIVVKVPGADDTPNWFYFRQDNNAGYGDGAFVWSNDSGSSWAIDTSLDLYFVELGNPPGDGGPNIAKLNRILAASIAGVDGVPWASIAKIDGVG